MIMDKQHIRTAIKRILESEGCSLAVLFGSFVERERFRDIDVMVAMEGGRPPSRGELLYLAQRLEKGVGYQFDVIGIDVPAVLLRAEIAKKGIPIIVEDGGLWLEFRFKAWIDEMDFRPLVEEFYAERFGV